MIPAFLSTELTERKIRRWSSFPPPRHAACAACRGLFLLRRLHLSTLWHIWVLW